jgi:hypothetical protein
MLSIVMELNSSREQNSCINITTIIYIMFSEKNCITYLFYYSALSTSISCLILLLFIHEEDVGMYVIIFGLGFGFFPWWTLFYLLMKQYNILPDEYVNEEETRGLIAKVPEIRSGTSSHKHHTPVHSDNKSHDKIIVS